MFARSKRLFLLVCCFARHHTCIACSPTFASTVKKLACNGASESARSFVTMRCSNELSPRICRAVVVASPEVEACDKRFPGHIVSRHPRARMDRWIGKVAIVTGASIGIGAAIADALVRAGVRVVGVGRRVQRIRDHAEELKGQKGELHAMECDMRKEEDILRVFRWTEKELGGVDILVNNAGVLVPEPIIDSSTENFRKIMEVNVIGVAICTREAVRSMKKRNVPGHIINLNSIAGHNAEIVTIPVNVYPASKYAVTGLSDSVRNELAAAKLNIKVTSISPGAVKTDMIMCMGIPEPVLDRLQVLKGKDIADAVLYALATPPNVQVKELTITPLTGVGSLLNHE